MLKIKSINKIQACVFDWAGTIIDYGAIASLQVMVDIFGSKKLIISKSEIRAKFTGASKKHHIKELLKIPRITQHFEKLYGKEPDESTVKEFKKLYEDHLLTVLANYAVEIPNAFSTINELRKKGIKIGSTTSYKREMMDIIAPIVEKNGFKPDYLITPSEVPNGRPFPYMMYHNALNLEVFSTDHMVKVGDSTADITEAHNAGAWSIGIIEGSSLMGLTLDEYINMSQKTNNPKQNELNLKLKHKIQTCKEKYISAGADYIVNNISEVPRIIKEINDKRMPCGDKPGNMTFIPPQPYILYTPGPITLSKRVKLPMMTDWGSREFEYLELVERVRSNLVNIATNNNPKGYTCVIMQGSGTFGVEATVSTVVPKNGKILVIENGEYGKRMTKIAKIAGKKYCTLSFDETEIPDVNKISDMLRSDKDITHVGFIHSETTTGILNPLKEIMQVVKQYGKIAIVDAMSSFAGVPIDVPKLDIDFLVSSSNKNIQGVPGFSFTIAKESLLEQSKGNATTISLDLYEQWAYLQKNKGGFRFTSPVHAIKALDEAINELQEEGGVEARYQRYSKLQKTLVDGMNNLNFKELDLKGYQGPIITTFHSPKHPDYNFMKFYTNLRDRRCVIYPGKLTVQDTFRIGTIGYLFQKDIMNLLTQVEDSIFWEKKL